MGKYKDTLLDQEENIGGVISVADQVLRDWVPKKGNGLSKKESRAAIVGFGLGLINACRSIVTGSTLEDNEDHTLYEWLCNAVVTARDDPDEYRRAMSVAFLMLSDDEVEALDDAISEVMTKIVEALKAEDE